MVDWSKLHPFIPKLVQRFETAAIDRREFLRTATLLGMSATAAYAVAGLAPGGMAARAQTAGGTLRIAHRVPDVSNPATLNWFRFSNVTFPVLQTLTYTDQDNVTRPLLCRNWEVSEDLKTWTIHLRPEARWHSGRPFTADDVVWNLTRLLDPATGSSSFGLMRPYLLNAVTVDGAETTELWAPDAIEKVDDLTVRLNLKEPQLAVPEHLFQYTSVMQDPEGNGVYGVGTNGTGPYELVEISTNQKAVFRARSDYWGEQKPVIETVEFVDLGDDQTAIFAAVAAGQVDGVFDIDFLQVPAYEQLPAITVYSTETATCGTFNMRVLEPPFDDPRVRLAMRYGVDVDPIMAIAIRGNGMPGEHHHVAPVHPEYAPLQKMARDVERAKALLAEAGLPDGFDAEVYVMAESPWHLATVQAMTEQLAEIGARLTINVLPSTQFWEVSDQVPLSFSDWAHRPLGLQMLALVYRTGVDWNSTKWSNAEFDRLLTEAEAVIDPDERRPIVAELERIMQEDGPIVMPFWVNIATAYNERVTGFRMHPAGTIFLNELGLA